MENRSASFHCVGFKTGREANGIHLPETKPSEIENIPSKVPSSPISVPAPRSRFEKTAADLFSLCEIPTQKSSIATENREKEIKKLKIFIFFLTS